MVVFFTMFMDKNHCTCTKLPLVIITWQTLNIVKRYNKMCTCLYNYVCAVQLSLTILPHHHLGKLWLNLGESTSWSAPTFFFVPNYYCGLPTLSCHNCLLILGDVNLSKVDWENYQSHRNFCDKIFELNLEQIVNKAAHISGNILDVALTKFFYQSANYVWVSFLWPFIWPFYN